MNFQGKRVVIIGGSCGISLATATAITAGAKVLIAGRYTRATGTVINVKVPHRTSRYSTVYP